MPKTAPFWQAFLLLQTEDDGDRPIVYDSKDPREASDPISVLILPHFHGALL
jgi:hypothetical protein